MRRPRLFPVVIAALVALVGVGLYVGLPRLFVPVTEEIEVGYRGEARLNPLLAAQRLYTRLGAPARTLPGEIRVPPPGYALVLVSPRRTLSRARVAALLRWLRDGGRLVLTPGDAPSADPLLAHFGVRLKTPAPGQREAAAPAPLETVLLPLRGKAKPARLEIPRAPRLIDGREAADLRVETSSGACLLRFREGKGQATVVSDAAFLENDRIGELDHAEIAWALVQKAEEGPPRGVWIAVRDEPPSLARLLGRHAAAALLSAAVLLAAWLWQTGARFGPLLPDPPRDRRSLLEHVEASGEYLLRAGRAGDLAAAARQALLHRIEVREPAWAKLPPPELAARLAAVSGLPVSRVAEALAGAVTGAADLVPVVQTLETLRRSL